MWIKCANGMVVNLNRAAVLGIAPRDMDKDEFALIVQSPPMPPIVVLEGTRALCQAALEEYFGKLNPKTIIQ